MTTKKTEIEAMRSAGLDESAIIREQERLAKVEKRKKRKKWKILALVVSVIFIIVIVWYIGWGRKILSANTEAVTVKIEKAAGQTVVYARIDEINGNEITYTIAEEVDTEEVSSSEKKFENSENGQGQNEFRENSDGTMPDMGSMPSGGFGGNSGGSRPDMGSMPESSSEGKNIGAAVQSEASVVKLSSNPGRGGMSGMSSFGGGEMPGMSSFGGGEMPDMSEMQGNFGNRGGMTSGAVTATTDSGMIVYDGVTYRVGTKTVTKYIPVGTDVTTKLGTVTTFSRLAAGDYVALVMDKDGNEEVIVAVYIIG